MAKVCQEVKQNQPQLPKFYAVEDQQSSQSYIVKLLTVSVSTIAYLKNLYNEDDYTEFSIKGGNLKVLNVKSENPDCKHLLGLLKGAFDAIRKQYLRELVLGIYTDPRDREGSFVESFNFLFEYGDGSHVTLSYKPNGEGKMSSIKKMNRKDVNRISKDLLDVLYSLCYNASFSGKKEYLTMKFYYYPNTPYDYQPPGFRRANDKEYDFLKQSKSNAAIVADVKTPWHSLGVGRPTENRQKNVHEHDADNIPRTTIQHCNESDLTLDLKNLAMSIKENVTPASGTVKYPATDAEPVAAHGSHVDTDMEVLLKPKCEGKHSETNGSLKSKENASDPNNEEENTTNGYKGVKWTRKVYRKVGDIHYVSNEPSVMELVTNGPSVEPETAVRKDLIAAGPSNASSGQDLNDDGTIFIKCICGSQCATDIFLQCSFCKTTQHPICYNNFQFNQATELCHVCVECSKTHDFYTAVDLKDLSDEERRAVSLHRLLLYRIFLKDDRELNVAEEAAVLLIPIDVVQQTISLLEEFGALKKKKARGSRRIYYINRDKASQAFHMFFSGETLGQEEGEQPGCRKRKLSNVTNLVSS